MFIIAEKDICNDLIFSSFERAVFLHKLPGNLTEISALLKKSFASAVGSVLDSEKCELEVTPDLDLHDGVNLLSENRQPSLGYISRFSVYNH